MRPSSGVAALLLSGIGIVGGSITSSACDGSTEVDSHTSGEPDGGTTDASSCTTTFPVSQPLSAPCCMGWGIDACGAGLFCAAFDGRTQATCYPERSRKHGETCLANNQCLSEHCSKVTNTCTLLPGSACSPGDPCERPLNGVPHACVESRCTATPCDPVAQTGCAPSETCDLAGETTGCRQPGPAKHGESCAPFTGHPCARGLTCVGSVCCKVCKTDADCVGEATCSTHEPWTYGSCSM